MDLNMSVKLEPAENKCEEFVIKVEDSDENQENQLAEHEQSYGEDSSKNLLKTELEEHGGSSDANLYVDHQVKEEIVIGPTQFHKEETGTAGFPCTLCNKIYKHKSSMIKHMWVVHKITALKPKAQKRNEKREKDIRHSKNEFAFIKCGVCIKYFANFSSLESHMKICPMLKVRQNSDIVTDKSLTIKKEKNILLLDKESKKVFINTESKKVNIKTENDVFEERGNEDNEALCNKREKNIFKKRVNKDNKEFCNEKEKYILNEEVNKDNKEFCNKKEKYIFEKGVNKELSNKKEKVILKKGMNNDKKEFGINKEIHNDTKESFDEKLDSNSKSRNKCQFCYKTFTFSGNLHRHIKQFHSNDSPYSCDKCSMKFARKDYILRHKLITHSEGSSETKIINCKCGRKFPNKWGLTRHKKANCPKTLKEGEFYCDYCKKLFHHKNRLTKHIKMHNMKNLICDYCQRGFRRRFNLILHIYKHTNAYPKMYKCEICDKQFTRKFSLTKHLIAHSGRKPFSCKYCGRRFGSKWGCISHEKLYCQPKEF